MIKRFDHPAIPRIVDIIDEEGTLFVIMDYIEGRTLAEVLDAQGAQSEDDVVDWAMQLLDALEYLHQRKPPVIYRDMKPSNVMLKPNGLVTLIDFGIAREYRDDGTSTTAAIGDTVQLGTRGFAPPEQYGGGGQTDARTDVYALGATMYNLVTGRNPAEPPYAMVPVRQARPELSAGLERIVAKATQPDPEDRYQGCAEMAYDLAHYREQDDARRAALRRTGRPLPFAHAGAQEGLELRRRHPDDRPRRQHGVLEGVPPLVVQGEVEPEQPPRGRAGLRVAEHDHGLRGDVDRPPLAPPLAHDAKLVVGGTHRAVAHRDSRLVHHDALPERPWPAGAYVGPAPAEEVAVDRGARTQPEPAGGHDICPEAHERAREGEEAQALRRGAGEDERPSAQGGEGRAHHEQAPAIEAHLTRVPHVPVAGEQVLGEGEVGARDRRVVRHGLQGGSSRRASRAWADETTTICRDWAATVLRT